MKLKILLVPLLLISSVLSGISNAQNRVVVIPLQEELDATSLNALCRGYDIMGEKPPAKFNCPPKLVFLLSDSGTDTGDLGGVRGAEELCNHRASNSNKAKGRFFKAWLSDSSSSPHKDFIHSQTPYVTVNGNLVANDWNDLTDGSIEYQIKTNENGGVLLGDVYVWTATTSEGEFINNGNNFSCAGWGSASEFVSGAVGGPYTDSRWSSRTSINCDGDYKTTGIYCFEQYRF